MQHSLI